MQEGNMHLNRKKWSQIARLSLVVLSWSGLLFLIYAIPFVFFLNNRIGIRNPYALYRWFMDLEFRLLPIAALFWLLLGILALMEILRERAKAKTDNPLPSPRDLLTEQFLPRVKNLLLKFRS